MAEQKWYETTHRWCQTNLTEIDAEVCDIGFWKQYWRQNHIQGIIVNAGGIVAYYPSRFPLQYRSRYLKDRDLLREFTDAAREMGLRVVARMDINRATKEFVDARPDWFARDRSGAPYAAGGRFLSCVNSSYYTEYIPQLLEEILTTYHPDGITDNSWQGPSAKQICYCDTCREKFSRDTGLDLPQAPDWSDKTYKVWIEWSFRCRLENWERFNAVARQFGGADCLWMGMVNANPVSAHCALYDLKEIGARSPMLFTDHQSRDELNGFEQNSLNGMLLHSLAGWDAVIPESMANYVRGVQTFRRACNPKLEMRKWMQEGMAGGISPWMHFIGARQEDRRQFENGRPLLDWHRQNEDVLYHRTPVSNVGLVWSQRNISFYGQDESKTLCAEPWRGFTRALTRARIPALPLHADHIARYAPGLAVLILPELAVMSDEQIQAVEDFVRRGGSVVYTGATGMLDEWGEARSRFPLDELFGIRRRDAVPLREQRRACESWEQYALHTYLRIQAPDHPILRGFADADILPFGGEFYEVDSDRLKTLATFVPAFPIYPPETSFMDPERMDSGRPLILAGETGFGGRVVYFAGDIDRRYCQYNLCDHGDLLEQAVRFALGGQETLRVQGKGYVDCRLYRQAGRFLLHLVNLSGANRNPGFLEEEYEVGPFEIAVRAQEFPVERAQLRVRGGSVPVRREGDWFVLALDRLESHELIVLE